MPERVTITLAFDKGDLAKITGGGKTIEPIELCLASLPPAEPVLVIERDAEAQSGLCTGLIEIGNADGGRARPGDFGDAK